MIESDMKCISVKALKGGLRRLRRRFSGMPNMVANLAVFELIEGYDAKCVGYIDLFLEKYTHYEVG